MIKKEIEFEKWDGTRTKKTFYFHLSKIAMARLNFSKKQGIEEWVKEAIKKEETLEILKTFEQLISVTYGVPHEDGEQFVQSEELSKAFMNTDAYSELVFELLNDVNAAAEFIKGIAPKDAQANIPDLREGVNELMKLNVPVETVELPQPPIYPTAPTPAVSPLGIVEEEPSPMIAYGVDLNNASVEQLEEILAKARAGK